MQHNQLASGIQKALLVALLSSTALSVQAQDTPQAKKDAVELDKIVVTAQNREQELQDVPIALQVMDASVIETTAATTIGDLDSFVPGLQVDETQATQPRFSLRGLSTDDIGIGTDSTVGVYVDGVYAGRGGGTVLPFLDVERIEVLKGPQGTLFGRNTAAGAISIITRLPGSEFETRARVRGGSHGKRHFDGMFNVPVSENVALRINAMHEQTDGYMRDGVTGKPLDDGRNDAVRMALSWNLGENTRALVSWDHEKLNQRSRPMVSLVAIDPLTGLPEYPVNPAHYLDPFKQAAVTDVVGNDETRNYDGGTLRVDHDFEWGHLTSTTAMHRYDTWNLAEEDGTNLQRLYIDTNNIERNKSWYQEFKFSGSTDRLDWVAGASWYQEDAKQSSVVDLNSSSVDTAAMYALGVPLFSVLQSVADQYGVPVQLLGQTWQESYDNTLKATSYAAFGDVIWHVNDKLNLTFGLRYTRDEKKFTWFNTYHRADALNQALQVLDQAGILAAVGAAAGMPLDAQFLAGFDLAFSDPVSMANKGITNRASNSWGDFSPRFVVDYHVNDNTMVFASLAKGYKAGGYNAFSPGAHFENEDVWNLETGIKQSLAGGRFEYEASLYHYKYDNRQAIWLDQTTSVPRYVTNVSDLKATGAEFSARWQPAKGLSFDFNLGWINSTYDQYVTPEGLNLTGAPTGEPRLSYSVGGSYRFDLASSGSMLASVRHGYRGAQRCNAASSGQGNCASYSAFRVGNASNRTDLFLQWRSPQEFWSIAAYANNVFDNRYVTGLRQYSTTVFGTLGASLSAPREYGLEVQYRF